MAESASKRAQGLDNYASPATCAAYRANDEKDDWHCISADALNRCQSSLSFFDAEGMRFHLPAYVIADLRGDFGFGMAICLTNIREYRVSQFALLSSAQCAAIKAFLRYLLDDPDEEFHHADIVRALAEFWTGGVMPSHTDSNT